MELANGKINNFYSKDTENKYWSNDFDIIETQGLNNVLLFINEIRSGSIVLDIGCAYGKFGKYLSNQNCMVYGIEKDKIAADIAINKNCYKDVFMFDLEDEQSLEYQRLCSTLKSVDTIIFSDVLEHLIDPTKILIRFSKLLRLNGSILISVPNLAHMDIMLHLLDGKFNYNSMGILDNTHLKFFTKLSFVQWINQINNDWDDIKFDCDFIGTTFLNNDYMKVINEKYNELYTIIQKYKYYNALQLLFKITKIRRDDNANNLDLLINEEYVSIVDNLGTILKDKVEIIPNNEVVYGERIWYENKLRTLNEYILINKEQEECLNNQNKYIDELETNLRVTSDEGKKKDKYIDELESNLRHTSDVCNKKDKYIDELETQVRGFASESSKKDKYITELERRIHELESDKCHMTNYIDELEGNINRISDESNKRHEYISGLDNKINETFLELQKKLERLEEAEHKLEKLSLELLNQEVCNTKQGDYINELETRCKEMHEIIIKKDEYISEIEQSIHYHIHKIEELEEGIKWHQDNEVNLTDELEKKKHDMNKLREIIFNMENSLSWKITKFIRR